MREFHPYMVRIVLSNMQLSINLFNNLFIVHNIQFLLNNFKNDFIGLFKELSFHNERTAFSYSRNLCGNHLDPTNNQNNLSSPCNTLKTDILKIFLNKLPANFCDLLSQSSMHAYTKI